MINNPFFNGIDVSLLQQTTITSQKFSKGVTVYTQGDCCLSLDLVISGSLVAYALSPKGSENIVFNFQQNNIIGANLLFSNTNHYPLNIYCTSNCELLHIKKSDVRILLHDYQFTMNFIKSISLNSQGMNKKITMYTQKSLRDNLLNYLKVLSAEQKTNTVILPTSKKQLADYLGVQRPSLFRELKLMKDEGIIRIDNRKIKLLSK
jgi:CRP-like cAMP-binding protein